MITTDRTNFHAFGDPSHYTPPNFMVLSTTVGKHSPTHIYTGYSLSIRCKIVCYYISLYCLFNWIYVFKFVLLYFFNWWIQFILHVDKLRSFCTFLVFFLGFSLSNWVWRNSLRTYKKIGYHQIQEKNSKLCGPSHLQQTFKTLNGKKQTEKVLHLTIWPWIWRYWFN